ncbi:MAG TPA: hypothetical protein VGV13_20205 [Methylomirabilota bacterium]|jgi:hypothetical protein|nr:hypothetical protein [Methylomirabilota bacterium]
MNARVANIGPRERRRRLILGVVALAVGVAAVAALIIGGAARGWIVLAVVPFWVGALGLIQARERT